MKNGSRFTEEKAIGKDALGNGVWCFAVLDALLQPGLEMTKS